MQFNTYYVPLLDMDLSYEDGLCNSPQADGAGLWTWISHEVLFHKTIIHMIRTVDLSRKRRMEK